MNIKTIICLVSCLLFVPFSVQASDLIQDLVELDFEQLMEVEITSVSKKSEKLSEAAAAVYVVSAEEIRRSGATSIPEALRLVPGVDAVQIDPNKWAVSIRGFSGRFANKLLVLIDGRSVYTPVHSGVYWEYLDYLMGDIARIEVIRGPGATLWGANAVNGIINIITKEAGDNSGGSLSVAAGNEYQGIGLSQAGDLSENAQWRGYLKGKRLDESLDSSGKDQDNGGDYLQTGFRMDIQPAENQWVIFQGDLYQDDLKEEQGVPDFFSSELIEIVNEQVDAVGGNLGGRWGLLSGLDSEITARLSYDFYDHQDFKYNEDRQTIDIELQHSFKPFTNHELVWGSGYRWSKNQMDYSLYVYGGEDTEYSDIWNFFIQDTVRFPDQNISLTFGTKVEYNNYTGSEVQPNIRASWTPDDQLTIWSSISRANRTPSQVDRSLTLNYDLETTAFGPALPILWQVKGNDDFKSEQLDAYELGIRWMPSDALSFDMATYYNEYKNLRSFEPDFANISSVVINGETYAALSVDSSNNTKGQSKGMEFLATWQATPSSRFRFVYNLLDIDLVDTQEHPYSFVMISMMATRTPKHQLSLWGSFDLNDAMELDLRLYYNSERTWKYDTIDETIDADFRFGWQVTPSFNLSFVGRNLLHSSNQQFQSETWPSDSLIERSFFIKGVVNW